MIANRNERDGEKPTPHYLSYTYGDSGGEPVVFGFVRSITPVEAESLRAAVADECEVLEKRAYRIHILDEVVLSTETKLKMRLRLKSLAKTIEREESLLSDDDRRLILLSDFLAEAQKAGDGGKPDVPLGVPVAPQRTLPKIYDPNYRAIQELLAIEKKKLARTKQHDTDPPKSGDSAEIEWSSMTVNDKMTFLLLRHNERQTWSVRQWAEELECSASTVHATEAWETCKALQAAEQQDRTASHRNITSNLD